MKRIYRENPNHRFNPLPAIRQIKIRIVLNPRTLFQHAALFVYWLLCTASIDQYPEQVLKKIIKSTNIETSLK